MDNKLNEMLSNVPSAKSAALERKQILNHLHHQVNQQAHQITNAQQEIAAVKTILNDARQRLERIKNRNIQSK